MHRQEAARLQGSWAGTAQAAVDAKATRGRFEGVAAAGWAQCFLAGQSLL